jgi:hypothetical protein
MGRFIVARAMPRPRQERDGYESVAGRQQLAQDRYAINKLEDEFYDTYLKERPKRKGVKVPFVTFVRDRKVLCHSKTCPEGPVVARHKVGFTSSRWLY